MSDRYRLHRPAEFREFIRQLRLEGGPFYVWGTVAAVLVMLAFIWTARLAGVLCAMLFVLYLTGNLS
jgi:hypothetical protein